MEGEYYTDWCCPLVLRSSNKRMKYFAVAMSALYLLAGSAFLFSNALINYIPRYRIPLGLLLVGYGVLRFYMWRKKFSEQASGE